MLRPDLRGGCLAPKNKSLARKDKSLDRSGATKGRHTPPRPGGIGIFWTEALVKTALLIAVLLLLGSAQAAEKCVNPDGTQDPVCAEHHDEDWGGEPRQRVTVTPPLPPGPPPIG
jgi:hypothetical protein